MVDSQNGSCKKEGGKGRGLEIREKSIARGAQRGLPIDNQSLG